MVTQHYRWDFIGLSTDTKPTPESSEKVTDGSTYYCSDTSKLYVWCKDNWYEKVEGGGGTSNFNTLTNRPKYNGTDMTGETNIPEVKDVNEYTIKGAGAPTTATVGTVGMLYEDTTNGKLYQCTAVDTTDPQNPIYTWDTVGGGVTPVQTTGTSTTDVMSQNAVSSMVFDDPGTDTAIRISGNHSGTMGTYGIIIGYRGTQYPNNAGNNSIGIGHNVQAFTDYATAVGDNAIANTNGVAFGNQAKAGSYAVSIGRGESSNTGVLIGYHGTITDGVKSISSVAIGYESKVPENCEGAIALGSHSGGSAITAKGMMHIGTSNTSRGYNNTNYRLLTGLYDGQSVHDAATVAQGNTLATSAPTTSTEGVLGQLYTDTTNMHTYQCTAIDTTDPDNPSYTWTQRW